MIAQKQLLGFIREQEADIEKTLVIGVNNTRERDPQVSERHVFPPTL